MLAEAATAANGVPAGVDLIYIYGGIILIFFGICGVLWKGVRIANRIHDQLIPNGGSSVRDAIDEVGEHLKRQDATLEGQNTHLAKQDEHLVRQDLKIENQDKLIEKISDRLDALFLINAGDRRQTSRRTDES
jgi:hypothetical protein